ncbi:MAG: hypothetical protein IH994_03190, partial [Proteobacteria bacterium]|nr:hypothetical protein [Pseudomonadota bacterium]
TPQDNQAGADGEQNWTDLTKYPLRQARFLFVRDKTWFAINSLPNVAVEYHANIIAHCAQHSRNGKWIVIYPYDKAEIVYRFNRPVYGFRAVVALMHPQGHVGLRVYADDSLIHETKDLLGTDEAKQIVATDEGFTELRIEVDSGGIATNDQFLIADPEILTDPESTPDPSTDSRQVGQFLQIWQHTTAVTDLVFSPDNRSLISGHSSGAVWVWDLETGKRLRGFTGLTQSPRLAISADGKRLLAVDRFGARIWNFHDRKELNVATFDPPAGLVRVAATPSGFQALIERKRIYQRWNLETDKPIGSQFRHGTLWVAGLELSPDGNRAFVMGRNGVKPPHES